MPRDGASNRTLLVQNFYECNPCQGDQCYRFERPECILSIRFEQVQSAVEEVLKNSGWHVEGKARLQQER